MPTRTDLSDPKKIRAKLRRCERELRSEKDEYGWYRDGGGKRYSLGPLHLLLGDLDGALGAFRWFDAEFPDDIGEPGQYLCWTLALHRAGDEEAAKRKLRQLALSNLYVVPHLLGDEVRPLEIWHGSNWALPSYLEAIPPEYFGLWTEEEKDWAREAYERGSVRPAVKRWIEIYCELEDLPPGPKRTALVNEGSALRRG